MNPVFKKIGRMFFTELLKKIMPRIKKREMTFSKPIHIGFTNTELTKSVKYKKFYRKFNPYFGQNILKSQYRDTISLVISWNRWFS